MKEQQKKIPILVCIFIALNFLWTSCGYLSWMYHLMDYTTASNVDWLTEVIGYLFQALGILSVYLFCKYKTNFSPMRHSFIGVIGLDFFFIILSVLSESILTALLFGYCMNYMHGWVAAYYLYYLATLVPKKNRALTFGLGYGIASIGSWAISLLGTGNFLCSRFALILYAVFVCITVGFLWIFDTIDQVKPAVSEKQSIQIHTIWIVGATVLLLSLVRGIGFYFPMSDVSTGINLEFSRAFYAIGLILAGIISDKNRKHGAISCALALVFPFVMITLTNEVSITIVFWILSYIFYGFYNVYRVIVFSDIAQMEQRYLCVAALGLFWGRIGDALGALCGILFSNNLTVLVSIASLGFVITFVLFFHVYYKIYHTTNEPELSEEDKLKSFAEEYQLSSREFEVLQLLIKGKTNNELSSELYISENTVKFHVRNLLKKTGCENRIALITLFKQK